MDTSTLPRHAYHHLMYTLRRNLPPAPPDPAAAIARDYAAIAQVSSLCPANAAEAAIAAQAVAANAQAMETMGLANAPTTDPKQVLQCVAQVASMMRQAQGALRVLHAMQAERRKREADGSAANSSAWIEYGAAQWMAEALPIAPRSGSCVSDCELKDQDMGYYSHIHAHETDSGKGFGPRSEAEGMRPSQNTGHSPVSQSRETDSADRFDPPCQGKTVVPSQDTKHTLTPQSRETKSGAAFDLPSDAEVRESSQDTTHILMMQSRETKPAVRLKPPPDAPAAGSSKNVKHPLAQQSHETDSVILRRRRPRRRKRRNAAGLTSSNPRHRR